MRNFSGILRRQWQEAQDKLQQGRLIERDAFSPFQPVMSSRLIKVVTGVRRCGKSVFSLQLLRGKKFGYVNFDDENLAGLRPEDLGEVLKAAYEVSGEINYLFLDEVQNIERWELFVNRLQRQGLNLIITGSSAKLLSKELATHLTGRHLSLELFPFSFAEFLCYKQISAVGRTVEEIGLIKNNLREYLINGGFPELFQEPRPELYLQNLYSTILMKDILLRHHLRYVRTFRDLASYVLTNFAREASFNKLKSIFKLGSDHTAKNYLYYLEEAYLLFLIEKFSYKKKEIVMENRKSYAIDTGFIQAVSFRFREDWSHLYENVVAIELLRRKTRQKDTEIYYWKNAQQEEVDFIVKQGLKVRQLIQVCYDLSDEKTRQREFRALLKAEEELRCSNLLVITDDSESEQTISWFGRTGMIRSVPLWKWLLEKAKTD